MKLTHEEQIALQDHIINTVKKLNQERDRLEDYKNYLEKTHYKQIDFVKQLKQENIRWYTESNSLKDWYYKQNKELQDIISSREKEMESTNLENKDLQSQIKKFESKIMKWSTVSNPSIWEEPSYFKEYLKILEEQDLLQRKYRELRQENTICEVKGVRVSRECENYVKEIQELKNTIDDLEDELVDSE